MRNASASSCLPVPRAIQRPPTSRENHAWYFSLACRPLAIISISEHSIELVLA